MRGVRSAECVRSDNEEAGFFGRGVGSLPVFLYSQEDLLQCHRNWRTMNM